MGMFDTFAGTVKCPSCGKDVVFREQTKNYGCLLTTFELGDYIDKGNANYCYEFLPQECPHCKNKTNLCAIIKHGQIVDFRPTSNISPEEFDKLENIEDGYLKNERYREACKKLLGNSRDIYIYENPPKAKDVFQIMEEEWVVDKVYKIDYKKMDKNFCNSIINKNTYYADIHLKRDESVKRLAQMKRHFPIVLDVQIIADIAKEEDGNIILIDG